MAAATTQKKTSAAKAVKAAPRREGASAPPRRTAPPPRRAHPGAWAAFFWFFGIFCLLGYFSVEAVLIDPVCGFLKGLMGYGFFLMPIALMGCGALLLIFREDTGRGRLACLLLVPFVMGAVLHVLIDPPAGTGVSSLGEMVTAMYQSGKVLQSGGVISGLLGWGTRRLLSVFLALPLLLAALVGLLMSAFHITPKMISDRMNARRARRQERYEAWERENRQQQRAERPALKAEPAPAPAEFRPVRRRVIDIPMDDDEEEPEVDSGEYAAPLSQSAAPAAASILAEDAEAEDAVPRQKRRSGGKQPVAPAEPEPVPEETPVAVPVAEPVPAAAAEAKPEAEPEAPAAEAVSTLQAPPSDPVKVEEFSSEVERSIRSNAKKGIDTEELIHETTAVARAVKEKDEMLAEEPDYCFPPVTLLHPGGGGGSDGREEIRANSARLQATLDSFGVNAAICDVTRGPTVTRYDLELEAGVKLAKLTNLAGDLALSLGVTGVRIAPIPDRISTVGVEVPNKTVSTVYLREIIDTDTFRRAPSKLTVALGKDIGGNAIVGNISKLPHLLIAGTTGSGKSVCMNCLILSLLYKATPEEVRLIMIDPKMVELGIYNGIPHLYIPVVTDPKKAAGSLQWSVVEMLKRYRMFSEAGVRDLAGFNAIRRRNGETPLPQVVIIIDELADLMMVASKEVEESICRVAQMGRASGMHLVIATQRPSSDVITGLMKANIPSRIAFAVSSGIESRIILDQQGAEKLVGNGDMLFAPIGIGKPNRIQGAFVTDDEREQIVSFIKQNGEPNYSEEIMHSIEQAAAEKDARDSKGGNAHAESADAAPAEDRSGYDELLPQAVDVIFETKQASVSMLQRRLKLGYSRAARIVDQMEEIGVVGPFEGSKPRQILITRDQWLEMQTVQGTAPVEKPVDQIAFNDVAKDFEDKPPEEWED